MTDPRNLGAVVRSTAAFGGHGVVVPERRSAGVTAAAWKASAGALARLPVARATNLVRTLRGYAAAGLIVVGLDGDGEVDLDDLEVAADPLVVVVGSEGQGLSRLVSEACDLRVRIPIVSGRSSRSTPPWRQASCSPRSPTGVVRRRSRRHRPAVRTTALS